MGKSVQDSFGFDKKCVFYLGVINSLENTFAILLTMSSTPLMYYEMSKIKDYTTDDSSQDFFALLYNV